MAFLIYSIEDDKDIAQIINRTLAKQGYEVYSFGNGKDFFQAFKERKPDLILLDLMLPDYSGLDILKTVRQDSNNDELNEFKNEIGIDALEEDLYGNIIMDKLEKDVKFKESFENNLKILIDKERH